MQFRMSYFHSYYTSKRIRKHASYLIAATGSYVIAHLRGFFTA